MVARLDPNPQESFREQLKNRFKTLLCIDDEDSHLRTLRRIFAELFNEIITCSDGEMAVEIINNMPPTGIILSDHHLYYGQTRPTSGLEIARATREKRAESGIPFIIATAGLRIRHVQTDLDQALRNKDIQGYLEKPIFPVELERIVRKILLESAFSD